MRNIAGATNSSGAPVNPLISIAKFGYELMIIAQVLFATTIAAAAAVLTVTSINFLALGSGMTQTPWGAAFQGLVFILTPFFIAILAALYSLGALLVFTYR